MTTSNQLDTVTRLELNELYARYTHAFDEGKAEELASLFTEDGMFIVDGAQPVKGTNGLVAMVKTSVEHRTGNRHLVSSVVVEPFAGAAVGRAYVQVVSIGSDAISLVALGRYDDEFAQVDGSWRFGVRRFTPFTDAKLAGAPMVVADPD